MYLYSILFTYNYYYIINIYNSNIVCLQHIILSHNALYTLSMDYIFILPLFTRLI